MRSIVYIHLGETLPDHLIYNIYNTLYVHRHYPKSFQLYVLVDETLVLILESQIQQLDLTNIKNNYIDIMKNVHVISIQSLSVPSQLDEFRGSFKVPTEFRDKFWLYTTERFFYLYEFMKQYELESCFHFENDVMLYIPIHQVDTSAADESNKLMYVCDSPRRGIASIFYAPSQESMSQFIEFIVKNCQYFKNDMDILGIYPNKISFNYDDTNQPFIFDGAAIGQFLCGTDPRNIDYVPFGFINETCTFKCDTCEFNFNPITQQFQCRKKNSGNAWCVIACLHIHSKELWKAMLSTFPFNESFVITGERIQSQCDVYISTAGISQFHSITLDDPKTLIINDFTTLVDKKEIVNECIPSGSKIFVYTHILRPFIDHVLPLLTGNHYQVITGNSDHGLTSEYESLYFDPRIDAVYGHNIEVGHDKIKYVPIGIANSQWLHGNTQALAEIVLKTRHLKKSNSLYINLNTTTFLYRKTILNKLQSLGYKTTQGGLEFSDYLKELNTYRFAMCVRGNGVDTHRLWECLYLNVIPVVIDNKETNMKHQIKYMKKMGIPLLVIEDIDHIESFEFDETLYELIMNSSTFDILKQNNETILNCQLSTEEL